jgi:hypothetical protein
VTHFDDCQYLDLIALSGRAIDEVEAIWKEALVDYSPRKTGRNPRNTLHMTSGVPPEIRTEYI